MKTYLTYGFALALGNLLILLLLFFAGFHTSTEHFIAGMVIGLFAGLALAIAVVIVGTRAARADKAPFSYGAAFKAGFFITLFATLFSIPLNSLYYGVINPGYGETTIAWTTEMMTKMNAPEVKIEEQQEKMRAKFTPMRQAINGVIGGIIIGAVISLITAACLKRKAPDQIPVTTA